MCWAIACTRQGAAEKEANPLRGKDCQPHCWKHCSSEGLPSRSFPLQHLPARAAGVTLNLEKAALGTPSAAGKAVKLARRDVNLLVTQRLIYPVHTMLLWEKLINQVCVILLRASVASGKGWQAGERYQGSTEGSVTSQDPRKEKPTGAEHRSESTVKMGHCCNIHRRRLEPH